MEDGQFENRGCAGINKMKERVQNENKTCEGGQSETEGVKGEPQ